MDVVETWITATAGFAELVAQVPDDRWSGPGLDRWTLRDLVGHTCSAGLREVTGAIGRPADVEAVPSPERYYAFATTIEPAILHAAIEASTEDARRTGAALGDHPATAVQRLADEATTAVLAAVPDMLVTTAAGGMRLARWLPTRTFELAVHSLDVASALGRTVVLPYDVLVETAVLAARIGVAIGQGADLVLALSGRRHLPEGFSVV